MAFGLVVFKSVINILTALEERSKQKVHTLPILLLLPYREPGSQGIVRSAVKYFHR